MTPIAVFYSLLSAVPPLNTRLRRQLLTCGRRQHSKWRAWQCKHGALPSKIRSISLILNFQRNLAFDIFDLTASLARGLVCLRLGRPPGSPGQAWSESRDGWIYTKDAQRRGTLHYTQLLGAANVSIPASSSLATDPSAMANQAKLRRQERKKVQGFTARVPSDAAYFNT
jgi:hypothetical protein